MIVRLSRAALHWQDNDSLARSYGNELLQFLLDLTDDPSPSASLHDFVIRADDAARATFAPAYLRGKRQAIRSLAALSIDDELWIEQKLHVNHGYLATSLAPAILTKIHRQSLHLPSARHERAAVLRRSFGHRIIELYGGVLWNVTEAGFRSGVKELAQHVARSPHHALVTEDDNQDEDQPAQQDEEKEDAWLLLLAGLTDTPIDELLAMITILVGVTYLTQQDPRVCAPCGSVAGDYFPPDIPPLPGEVCAGGPLCRCWLEIAISLESAVAA